MANVAEDATGLPAHQFGDHLVTLNRREIGDIVDLGSQRWIVRLDKQAEPRHRAHPHFEHQRQPGPSVVRHAPCMRRQIQRGIVGRRRGFSTGATQT
jgi:hypothetical protein